MNRHPKIAGVLPVIKPTGPTSHDVVQVARRVLQERQIGHTGTLDPAAGGVIVLCIGPYTKLVTYLTASDKTYRGEIGLGIETDTDDSEGKPFGYTDPSTVTLDHARAAAARYVGEIEQTPPRYAAIKVAGKKLYEYARKGEEVEVEPRRVNVYSFEVLGLKRGNLPEKFIGDLNIPPAAIESGIKKLEFSTRVSSGTYVRAFARDIGRDLGCGGYLMNLFRESVGQFGESHAVSYEELKNNPEAVREHLLRGENAMDAARYPILRILTAYEDRVFRGQPVHDKMMVEPEAAATVPDGAVCGISSENGALLAIMQAERFQTQMQSNVYGSRFAVHFRSLRVFPEGLQ